MRSKGPVCVKEWASTREEQGFRVARKRPACVKEGASTWGEMGLGVARKGEPLNAVGEQMRASGPRSSETSSPPGLVPTPVIIFFLLLFTLVTGPGRSLSLKLSDTRVYEPHIRARLGTTSHFCGVVVLNWGGEPRSSGTSSPPGLVPTPVIILRILVYLVIYDSG